MNNFNNRNDGFGREFDTYGHGGDLRLYMIVAINANHEEILNILEAERLGGQSYTLSTSNIIFESYYTSEQISDVFKTRKLLSGYNFLLIDLTDVTDTSSIKFHLNPKANVKIGEMMQFLLSFFDKEDVKARMNSKNIASERNIDRILDKINRQGVDSLSRKEKSLLNKYKEEL